MSDKEFNSYIDTASEPAKELEGDVKEKEEQKLEVKVDDVPNSSGEKEESGAEVVAKLQREALGEPDPKEKEEEGSDIPDAFTNACLEQGWTEEEIKEFASDLDDTSLLSLIPELLNKEEIAVKKEAKEEKSKPAEKAAEKPANEDIAALKKELAEIKDKIGKDDSARKVQDEEAMVQTVNQVFDEVSKDFEIFGKTEELLKYPAGPKKGQFVPTSPAMVARAKVWDKAVPFINGGTPVKEAMDIALTWYKGANLEKDIHRNVIKDLKKHEKKLSAKRSGKETVKVYESEEERQADVVRAAARKAGIKGKYDI